MKPDIVPSHPDPAQERTPAPTWQRRIDIVLKRGVSLLVPAMIWIALGMLILATNSPGSTSPCSSERADPCIFPPELVLVRPALVLIAVGAVLMLIRSRGWRVSACGLLLMGGLLRLIDAWGAVFPNGPNDAAEHYSRIGNTYVDRPTTGGLMALAGSGMIVVVSLTWMMFLAVRRSVISESPNDHSGISR